MPDSSEEEQTKKEAKQHGLKLKKAAIKRRKEGATPYPPLMVFPEGCCTRDDTLLQFKVGAFLSGVKKAGK